MFLELITRTEFYFISWVDFCKQNCAISFGLIMMTDVYTLFLGMNYNDKIKSLFLGLTQLCYVYIILYFADCSQLYRIALCFLARVDF